MSSTMHFTYGANECCEERPEFRVTKINTLGTTLIDVCAEHRDTCAATALRYVHGWGPVRVSIEEIQQTNNFEVEVRITLDDFPGDKETAHKFVQGVLDEAHKNAALKVGRNPGWNWDMLEGCVLSRDEEGVLS